MNQQLLFERVVKFTLGLEGGEANHPEDPGQLTNFGISSRYHPDVDVESLTQEEAIEIYREYYWLNPRIAELHKLWAFVVFDTAVHTGAKQAIAWLQEVCRVTPDGVIGPKTLGAAGRARSTYHLGLYLAKRLEHMESRSHKAPFIMGWRIRIMELYANAVVLG